MQELVRTAPSVPVTRYNKLPLSGLIQILKKVIIMFNEAQSSLFNFNFSNRLDWLTGELSYNGKCFENRVGGMEDLSCVEILHTGIDTYKGKFHGTINRDFANKVRLKLDNDFNPIFNLCGTEFILSPSSKASRYKYKLHSKSMGILIFFGDYFLREDSWLADDKGKVKFEISPEIIYNNGLEAIESMISNFNQEMMFNYYSSACDVHMCVDLQGWRPPSDLIEDMVTMTRRKVSYNGIDEFDFDLTSSAVRYGSNDSFLFGRASSSQLATYNKTKEARVKGTTTFWQSVWAFNNVAYDSEKEVFRVELRLPASVLKNLVKRDDGTACKIIDLQSLSTHLNTLWIYGLSRLFRYDYDTSKTKKKTIRPIWQLLLDDVSFNEHYEPTDYKREYVVVDDSIDKNLALLMGNFTTVMAKAGVSTEKMLETIQSQPFYPQLLAYVAEKKQLNEEHYVAYIVNLYRKKRVEFDKRAGASSLDFAKFRRNYRASKTLEEAKAEAWAMKDKKA